MRPVISVLVHAERRIESAAEHPILESLDEAAEHPRDLLQLAAKGVVVIARDEAVPAGQFKQRDALLDRSADDREEVASVGLLEAAVALG